MAKESNWRRLRVLLVETDDAFVGQASRAFQNATGRAVVSRGHTLAEARARMAAHPQDIVVAELHLPDGTATELLMSNGERTNVPVIVLVRHGQERDTAAAIEAGAVECYLKNGAEVDDLPDVVARCVRKWNHIVERERAEKTILQIRDQIRHYQQMVTSGLITRGVAYEIANMLNPILELAESALATIPPRGEAREEIEQVIEVARLAKELVRDEITEDSNAGTKKSPVDICRLAGEVLDLLRPVAPPGVETRIRTTTDDTIVFADPTHIKRVIMTLCANAYDAMRSGGGVLHVDLDVFDAGAGIEADRTYVRVTVTDTGRGMNRKTAERVFDPRFSVKSSREGTRLGLPLASEIVKSYGGNISVESEPGKGSVFQVVLPRLDGSTTSASDEKQHC